MFSRVRPFHHWSEWKPSRLGILFMILIQDLSSFDVNMSSDTTTAPYVVIMVVPRRPCSNSICAVVLSYSKVVILISYWELSVQSIDRFLSSIFFLNF